jgi:hypothetical protein
MNKIKLTKEQIKIIESELKKEEAELIDIPKSGHGWDIINCKDRIDILKNIVASGEISVYPY